MLQNADGIITQKFIPGDPVFLVLFKRKKFPLKNDTKGVGQFFFFLGVKGASNRGFYMINDSKNNWCSVTFKRNLVFDCFASGVYFFTFFDLNFE